MDAAICGAGPGGDDRQRFRRQAVKPLGNSDWVASLGVRTEGRPVTVAADLFVWDGTFHHKYKIREFAARRLVEGRQEFIADRIREHGVVQVNLGKSRNGAEHYIFDAGLACGRYGNRITVAAKTARDPEDMNLGDFGPVFGHSAGLGLHFLPVWTVRRCGVHAPHTLHAHGGALLSQFDFGQFSPRTSDHSRSSDCVMNRPGGHPSPIICRHPRTTQGTAGKIAVSPLPAEPSSLDSDSWTRQACLACALFSAALRGRASPAR